MFTERWPEIVVPNPGGSDDPLGESILADDQPWLRVFEPRDTRLVLGRAQDPTRELIVDHAQADAVPIHRRVSGGGAVVLAPGMVVVALRLARSMTSADRCFALINQPLIAAVEAAGGPTLACHGHGDLAVPGDQPRKVLGASLRQRRDRLYYLGVFLVQDAIAAMDRYLASPSREPDYRGARNHADFCANLGALGVATDDLIAAIHHECTALLQ